MNLCFLQAQLNLEHHLDLLLQQYQLSQENQVHLAGLSYLWLLLNLELQPDLSYPLLPEHLKAPRLQSHLEPLRLPKPLVLRLDLMTQCPLTGPAVQEHPECPKLLEHPPIL